MPLLLESISPTLYEHNCANFLAPVKNLTTFCARLFRTKVSRGAFLCLQWRLNFLFAQEYWRNCANKMLVKLTPLPQAQKRFMRNFRTKKPRVKCWWNWPLLSSDCSFFWFSSPLNFLNPHLTGKKSKSKVKRKNEKKRRKKWGRGEREQNIRF